MPVWLGFTKTGERGLPKMRSQKQNRERPGHSVDHVKGFQSSQEEATED